MTDSTNPAPPVEKLRGKQALVELANTQMNLSLERWGQLCGAILADLDHLSSLTVENERLRAVVPQEIVAALFSDLRDRRLLKWLFTAEPESHGAIGYVDGPIDRETQCEIADAWKTIISAALSSLPAMKGDEP